MMTEYYRIAEKRIRISSIHDQVHKLCADYRDPDGPSGREEQRDQKDIPVDIIVCISQEDIDFERRKSERERHGRSMTGVSRGSSYSFSDPYLETLAVYRRIAEKMPDFDTILFHGSCVAVDGVGYLFAAKSGTGKSTHTRLWRQVFGDRAVMINDDKPMIRAGSEGEGPVIFGTPWDGKHHLSTNTCVPLKDLCILERAGENTIRALSPQEAYPMLLKQVYRPMNLPAMEKTLCILDRLMTSVGLWRLGCTIDPQAACIAYNAFQNESVH